VRKSRDVGRRRERKREDKRGQHRKTESINAKQCMGAREHDRTLRSSFSDSVLQIHAILSAPSILPHPRSESTRCPTILCFCLSSCLSLLLAMPLLRPRFSVALWQWADTLNISERRITLHRFSRTLIKKRWRYLMYEDLSQ